MMIHVPNVLTPEQVARCRDVMEKTAWVDGCVTAGHQSAKVKNNLQLPEGSPEARELGGMVLEALARNNLFMSAVLPKQVFPPLFNRYGAGMTFGAHVDNAIRGIANSGIRIRTDVSSTLFISRPEDYDGGELVVEDTYGSHSVKLPAGDMIVYPATSLHHVTPSASVCLNRTFPSSRSFGLKEKGRTAGIRSAFLSDQTAGIVGSGASSSV